MFQDLQWMPELQKIPNPDSCLVSNGQVVYWMAGIRWTERVFHVLGGVKRDGVRFHHSIQNSVKFKIRALFIAGIFYLILSEHS